MIPMKTTIVYLTDEDAKRFVQFQKHHAIMGLLESIDAFKIRNGWIKIHFDDKGMIGVVEKHQDYRL